MKLGRHPERSEGSRVRRGSLGRRSRSLAALGTTLLLPCAIAAQPVVKEQQQTTRAGVYTAAQATRGAEVYVMTCKSCHTPASHTGVTFATWWKGKTLGDLYGFVSTRMPKNDPGGLDPQQYADVVAYLLKLNALPAGDAELLPDSSALAPIRIDVGAAAPKRAPRKP